MDPEKHLDFLVDAFALLADQHRDARLVFAGDGSARKGVEEKVKGMHLEDRVHFLGMVNRTDIPDVLHDATVFLSASITEVHPISVIEAIACGLPLVAVQDEAFGGMIENDQNGYLVPMDVKVFSQTISALIADREKLDRFGKKSAELSQKFSIEGQVEALENLYIEAILQNWRGKSIMSTLLRMGRD
jgi:1,2-diacylglycerol 3-alpha-glucosyltransferase